MSNSGVSIMLLKKIHVSYGSSNITSNAVEYRPVF